MIQTTPDQAQLKKEQAQSLREKLEQSKELKLLAVKIFVLQAFLRSKKFKLGYYYFFMDRDLNKISEQKFNELMQFVIGTGVQIDNDGNPIRFYCNNWADKIGDKIIDLLNNDAHMKGSYEFGLSQTYDNMSQHSIVTLQNIHVPGDNSPMNEYCKINPIKAFLFGMNSEKQSTEVDIEELKQIAQRLVDLNGNERIKEDMKIKVRTFLLGKLVEARTEFHDALNGDPNTTEIKQILEKQIRGYQARINELLKLTS